MFNVFITSVFELTFNIYYQVDCESKASSVAHFSFMHFYPPPDGGKMKD
jgi:hypothetical protein